MDETFKQQLKEWLRENLKVTVDVKCPMTGGTFYEIGLRIIGDEKPFSVETIAIEDQEGN